MLNLKKRKELKNPSMSHVLRVYGDQFVKIKPSLSNEEAYFTIAPAGLLCWFCCFEIRPKMVLPMPVRYDGHSSTFVVAGAFCSWSCIKAYLRDYKKTVVCGGSDLLWLFRKQCGGGRGPINAAPPRSLLKAFGGSMDIQEFRNASDSNVYITLAPRMIIYEQVVHERKRGEEVRRLSEQPPKLDDCVDLDSRGVGEAKMETLRLKRPKIVLKKSNLLEITLGLCQNPTH
jgi:hypothetical protein